VPRAEKSAADDFQVQNWEKSLNSLKNASSSQNFTVRTVTHNCPGHETNFSALKRARKLLKLKIAHNFNSNTHITTCLFGVNTLTDD
jgi:hypothetical protein